MQIGSVSQYLNTINLFSLYNTTSSEHSPSEQLRAESSVGPNDTLDTSHFFDRVDSYLEGFQYGNQDDGMSNLVASLRKNLDYYRQSNAGIEDTTGLQTDSISLLQNDVEQLIDNVQFSGDGRGFDIALGQIRDAFADYREIFSGMVDEYSVDAILEGREDAAVDTSDVVSYRLDLTSELNRTFNSLLDNVNSTATDTSDVLSEGSETNPLSVTFDMQAAEQEAYQDVERLMGPGTDEPLSAIARQVILGLDTDLTTSIENAVKTLRTGDVQQNKGGADTTESQENTMSDEETVDAESPQTDINLLVQRLMQFIDVDVEQFLSTSAGGMTG